MELCKQGNLGVSMLSSGVDIQFPVGKHDEFNDFHGENQRSGMDFRMDALKTF